MTTSKTILISAVSLVEGGLFPHILTKFKYFQTHGYKLFILCDDGIYPLPKIDNIYTYVKNQKFSKKIHSGKIGKIEFIFYSLKSNLLTLLKLNNILKFNFDVIYSTSAVLNLCIIPYFIKILKPKIKWVTIFDNTVPLFDPGNPVVRLLAWIFYNLSLILLKKANHIFVISVELQQYLLSHNFTQKQLTITGNAIESETLKLAKKDKTKKYDALFIGRINETKGIFDMLEVLSIVTKKFPKFVLAILGKGDPETTAQFKASIKHKNLGKNIKFLGYKIGIEKYSIIKSSKLFIFLSKSKSESFGIALLEAVSCGLPAITYDLTPYKTIYKNNEIFSYPIGNIEQVSSKVIEIFDKKQFNNLSGQKLLGKYTWENIAKIEINKL